MAPACRKPEHGPEFHPWPRGPANLSVQPCEQFCQWCTEPGTPKTAGNLRAHAARHLAKHPEFTVAKSIVGRPSLAIRRASPATPSSSSDVSGSVKDPLEETVEASLERQGEENPLEGQAEEKHLEEQEEEQPKLREPSTRRKGKKKANN